MWESMPSGPLLVLAVTLWPVWHFLRLFPCKTASCLNTEKVRDKVVAVMRHDMGLLGLFNPDVLDPQKGCIKQARKKKQTFAATRIEYLKVGEAQEKCLSS